MDTALSLKRSRELRKNSTDAEQLLWRHLRDRRFRGAKFRRQHSVTPYILDFYCAENSLAVELDGGQHFGVDKSKYDDKRTNYLANKGIRVVRFSNAEIFNQLDDVIEAIALALTHTRHPDAPQDTSPREAGEAGRDGASHPPR